MTTAASSAKQALELIIFGLTNPRNCCWPTPKPWTKKERDEAMLQAARNALAALNQVCSVDTPEKIISEYEEIFGRLHLTERSWLLRRFSQSTIEPRTESRCEQDEGA